MSNNGYLPVTVALSVGLAVGSIGAEKRMYHVEQAEKETLHAACVADRRAQTGTLERVVENEGSITLYEIRMPQPDGTYAVVPMRGDLITKPDSVQAERFAGRAEARAESHVPVTVTYCLVPYALSITPN